MPSRRYRYFADPVTSQREALRSLQAKNSLYPTLRYAEYVLDRRRSDIIAQRQNRTIV